MTHAVLFVDDDENILAAFRRSFRNTFDITTVTNAVDALKLLIAGQTYAVIVSDLCMPAVDGLRLLNEVRVRSPYTRRLMLSGNADVTSAVTAHDNQDIDRFITKPCSSERLAAAIREAIDLYDRDLTVRRGLGLQTPPPASMRNVRPSHIMPGDILRADLALPNGKVLLRRGEVVGEDLLPRIRDLVAAHQLSDFVLIEREPVR